ncbi:hypothetical protein SAMN02910369_02000 [Lachnospiraceae bacterium NE2001]|nr:hypothetical protein SAMN02910369_02000 [Lachnospiraceae bacterium NE2001]
MSHTEELKEIKHIKKDITKVLKASDMPNFNTEDKELAEKKNIKAKKRRVGLLVFFSVSFLVVAAFLVYTIFSYFKSRETGGATYPGKIAYAYIEIFNKEGSYSLSDFVSKECPHRESYIHHIEDGMKLNQDYIKKLDEGAAIVTVGTSYDEKSRKDILTSKGYKKTKASDVKDVTLVTTYTDSTGNVSTSKLTYVFTVMEVSGKWFLIDMVQQINSEADLIATDTDATATDASPTDATALDASATDANGLSCSLFSKELIFDGKTYTIPFDYSKIAKKYTFELADYGYEEGYQLSSGDMITGTIALANKDMDENVSIWVGFINEAEKAADLKDTKVNSFRMDVRWADTEKYPELILPNEITWGSTAEDILAAYGEPQETPVYSDEYGYTVYRYTNASRDYNVELIVYDELGLTEISLRAY